MRKVLIPAVILLVFSLLTGMALVWWQNREINSLDRHIQTTMDRALETSQVLLSSNQTGGSEIRLRLHPRLLNEVLQELKGFEHLSKKRNLLRVEEVGIHFREGYIEAQLLADFTWHRGWYRGPVSARYAVFSQVDSLGRCQLDFHVMDVKPLAYHGPFQSLLARWIRLKLADKLPLPSLQLPLNLVQQHHLKAQTKLVRRGDIKLKAPERQIELTLEQGMVAIQPWGLLVEIGKLRGGDGPTIKAPLPTADFNKGFAEDLLFETSLTPLNQLLHAWFQPKRDLLVSAAHVPEVWAKEKRVLGIKVRSRIDLENVTGYFEIEPPELAIDGSALTMKVDLTGQLQGTIRGRVYGFNINKPFKASPVLHETLHLNLEDTSEEIHLSVKPEELHLMVGFETRIAGRKVAFNHRVPLKSDQMIAPLPLTKLWAQSFQVPTRLHNRKVIESRPVILKVHWTIVFPEDDGQWFGLTGRLALSPSEGQASVKDDQEEEE